MKNGKVRVLSPLLIELSGDHLFVSDYEIGDIIAYSLETGEEVARVSSGDKGVCGISISDDGYLYFVNMISNEVIMIQPN